MNNTFTGPKPTPLTGVTPGAATFNSAGAVALKPPYFTDKKVLITGASSGLGMALAYYYLNNGQCLACDPMCKTCNGPSASNCLSCLEGSV